MMWFATIPVMERSCCPVIRAVSARSGGGFIRGLRVIPVVGALTRSRFYTETTENHGAERTRIRVAVIGLGRLQERSI